MPTILVLERPQRMLTQWLSSNLMVISASGQQLHVVVQLARGDGAGAFLFDLGVAGGAQAEIKIGGGQRQLVAGSFER